jgi:succinate dehydrogenase / fumarate reductase cytochrome b subunit
VKFAYFPGCAAADTCQELDAATRAVAEELRIGLVDLETATCCGVGTLQAKDPEGALALNARTLAMAEALGLDILTVCGTCQMYLAGANQAMRDPGTRDHVNRRLREGLAYGGGVRVKHLLRVLLEDVGPRRLAAHVRRPLGDFAVGAFYGCRLLKAPGADAYDDPGNPQAIERLVRLLGGRPVVYEARTACCGYPVLATRAGDAVRTSGGALRAAKAAGAATVATPCPLCHLVLDGHQTEASRAVGERLDVPVLHVSQLVGLAFGVAPARLGLRHHMVSTRPLVRMLESAEVVHA